jgi:hypothetical protein
VSTIIGRAMNSIAVEKRQAVPLLAAFVVALRSHVPKSIHAMSDHVERRFAEFAGVPYQSQASRQQWEELWEMEAERWQLRIGVCRLKKGSEWRDYTALKLQLFLEP